MFCPICGASNAENARFCTTCGAPLTHVEQRESAARPEAAAQREPALQAEPLQAETPQAEAPTHTPHAHLEPQEPGSLAGVAPAAEAPATDTASVAAAVLEIPAGAPAASCPRLDVTPSAGICTMRAISAALYSFLLLSLGIDFALHGAATIGALAGLGRSTTTQAAIVFAILGILLVLLLGIPAWGFARALPRRQGRATTASPARTPHLVVPLACAIAATAVSALFIALRSTMPSITTGIADPLELVFEPAVWHFGSWASPHVPLLVIALALALVSTALGSPDGTWRMGGTPSAGGGRTATAGSRTLVCLVALVLAMAGSSALSGCTSCSSSDPGGSAASQGSVSVASEPADETAAEPAEAPSRDVILTLDVSGSMEGDRLAKMQDAAKTFIDVVMGERTRVGLVSYAQDAHVLADLTDDETVLTQGIDALAAAGDTDIEASLRQAEQMLAESDADQKIIVLMSDGEPTEGLAGDDLIAYAGTLKDQGTRIYTIGLDESSEGHALQLAIANEGCRYDVENADELRGFFSDIASEVTGERYLYVRITVPRGAAQIDVTLDGETLSSTADGQERTSFGTLSYEDNVDGAGTAAQDGVTVLRLKEGPAYDVSITGTADAAMDVTVGLADEAGEYEDQRSFTGIPLTEGTVVSLAASDAERTQLSVSQPAGAGSEATGAAGSAAGSDGGQAAGGSGSGDRTSADGGSNGSGGAGSGAGAPGNGSTGAGARGAGSEATGHTLTFEAGANESVDASSAANAVDGTDEDTAANADSSTTRGDLARERAAAIVVIVVTALCTIAIAVTGCALLARALSGGARVASCIVFIIATLAAGAFVCWQSDAPRMLMEPEPTSAPTPEATEEEAAPETSSTVMIGDVSEHALAPTTRIVPLDSEGEALDDYSVAVCRAFDTEGRALDLSGVEPLDVDDDRGFTLEDVLGDVADGTICYLSVTDNSEIGEQSLPPLRVDSSSEEGNLSIKRIEPGSEVGTTDAMQAMAFLNKIAQLETLYGAPSVESIPQNSSLSIDGARGLALAQIIDFGDGVPRLLVGYSSDPSADYSDMDTEDGMHLEVWEYDERMGYLRNVWQGEPNVGTGPVPLHYARVLSWEHNGTTMRALVCGVVEGFGADTPMSEVLHQMTFVGVRGDESFGELDVDEISSQWPRPDAWAYPDYTTGYSFVGEPEDVSACVQTVEDTTAELQAAFDAARG